LSISSVSYEEQTGQRAGLLHTAGFGFAGGVFSQAVGFGYGKNYIKMGQGGVFGGGWQNRFAMGAKGAASQLYGMEATKTGVGRIAKKHPASFLGWRDVQGGALEAAMKQPAGSAARRTALRSVPKSALGAAMKSPGRMAVRGLGSVLGLGMVAMEAYHGYQEGGVLGAATAAGKEAAMWAMMGVGETAFASMTGFSASAVFLPVAVAAGAAYGGYKAMKYGGEVSKNLRNLDMGTPMIDPHGFGHTMRQRALMGIQRSHINGRMALGSEAVIMSTGMMR